VKQSRKLALILRVAAMIALGAALVPVLSSPAEAQAAVTTSAASPISTTTATLNGSVNPEGDSDTVTFCYSTTSSQVTSCGAGSTLFTGSTSPATGSSVVTETANLTGLTPGTTYYFNLEATDSGDTTYYGTPTSFTTSTEAPTATVSAATGITTTGATLNGSVNAEGTSTTVTFCYSTSSSLSSCGGATSTAAIPPTATGTSATAETATLTGLAPNTEYYFQIEAVGSSTVYSSVLSFTVTGTTPPPPSPPRRS